MMSFGKPRPNQEEDKWRYRLDQFVKANQEKLAALVWGIYRYEGDQVILGIDIAPQPHFIYCPRQAVEDLNQQVDYRIQEVLGIIDGHDPEKEVVLLGLGEGQVKLINFQPEVPPPECFQKLDVKIGVLFDQLEAKLKQYFQD